MQRLLCAVILLFLAFSPAAADVRIKASPGGEVTGFLELFERLRQSGQRVIIDGPCYSACTLVLSIVPASRICVTRHAILGFHAARKVDRYGNEYPAPRETRLFNETYPAPIRDWIRRHGGLRGKPIYLRGRELAEIYPVCR
jgi:hypothetical protein